MRKSLISLLMLLAMTLPSCIKRTVIPDTELAKIFRDAFLTNAYVLDNKIKFDTLQVYQPIFDKYGYSVEDVSYTVGSFSKRKSARLSDVVEQAIQLLEEGEELYRYETMILDTIEAKALRAAGSRYYYDEQVEYYSVRDTADLRIKLNDLQPGDYKLSFDYLVDSLDNNRSNYRSLTWVARPGSELRRGLTTTNLRKNNRNSVNRKFSFDTLTSQLVIVLAESFESKRNHHITFWDITVDYTPPTEVAIDKLYKNKLDVRVFADDFFNIFQKDSL